MFNKIKLVALVIFAANLSFGQDPYTEALRSSYKGVFENFNTAGIAQGVVIASPSTKEPNYFYHWVRDAGLSMMEMVELYKLPLKPERRQILERQIQNWIYFEVQNQNTALSQSHLGEPIFTVVGTIFSGPWGRPQNDGPAIRSIAMINYAFTLLDQGRVSEVQQLYRSEYPTQAPIKRDLEYVSHHWQDQSFDLWEEVLGQHFFTRMAQRMALIKGAQLAQRMNDQGAAEFYLNQARLIEVELNLHRNQSKGYIVATLNQTDGWKHKTSNLDVSVILASLYFSMNDGFFTVDDPWIQATANKLEETFTQIYEINQNFKNLSPGIGRYPEDVYNGNGFGEANPWFLATNAYAEYYCKLSYLNRDSDSSQQLKLKATGFLDRTIFHSAAGGRMTEQFNRHTGFNQGARDLTWSYISYIRAFRICINNSSPLDLSEIESLR